MSDSDTESSIDPLDAAIFSNYEAKEAPAPARRRTSNRDFKDSDDESQSDSEESEKGEEGEEGKEGEEGEEAESGSAASPVPQPPQPLLTGESLLPTAADRALSREKRRAAKKNKSVDFLARICAKQDALLKSLPEDPIPLPAYVPGCGPIYNYNGPLAYLRREFGPAPNAYRILLESLNRKEALCKPVVPPVVPPVVKRGVKRVRFEVDVKACA